MDLADVLREKGPKRMYCVTTVLVLLLSCAVGFYVQPDVVVFTVDPSDTVTCLGCEVELTCGVRLRETGAQLPQPEMTWERNGTQLDGTEPGVTITFAELDGVDSVYFNLSYLRIVGIGLEHAGAYRCVVTDGTRVYYCRNLPCVPTVTVSKSATLTVLEEYTGEYQQVNVSTCGVTVLECGSIPAGQWSKVLFNWRRNSMELDLTTEEDAELLSNGDLVLVDRGQTVFGLYECAVAPTSSSDVTTVVTQYWLQPEEGVETVEARMFTTISYVNEHTQLEIVCVMNLQACGVEIKWTSRSNEVIQNAQPTLYGRVLHLTYNAGSDHTYCCEPKEREIVRIILKFNVSSLVSGDAQVESIKEEIQNQTVIVFTEEFNFRVGHNLSVEVENSSEAGAVIVDVQVVVTELGSEEIDELQSEAFTLVTSSGMNFTPTIVHVSRESLPLPPSLEVNESLCVELNRIDTPVLTSSTIDETILVDHTNSSENSCTIPCGVTSATANQTTAWFHNGLPVTGPNYAIVHDDLEVTYNNESFLDVSGVYQCFVTNPAGSIAAVKRILPKGYSNPPSRPSREYTPRRSRDPEVASARLQWDKPEYMADLQASHLNFKVDHHLESSSTTETHLDVFLPFFSFIYISVSLVEESTGQYLSEKAEVYVPISSRDSCNDYTPYPPVLTLDCHGSEVTVRWSPSNGSPKPHMYFVSGLCTTSGGLLYAEYNEEYSGSGVDTIGNITVGSACAFRSAVLPIQSNSAPQQCYYLELVDWTSVKCDLTAKAGLEHSEYRVHEGNGSVEVCVVSNGHGFTAIVTTIGNGSASAGEDYVETVQGLEFNVSSEGKACTFLHIIDDGVVEERERTFQLEVVFDSTYIEGNRSTATIVITDDDSVVASFSQPSYSVSEDSGAVWVCVGVEGDIRREVSMNMSTFDHTATADINYNATVKELVFTETVRNVCSTVIILRDHVVTNDTVFAVHLASEDSAVELPQPDILVWISDRDVVRFDFEKDHYEAVEGSNVTVCVLLKEGDLGRDVHLKLRTANGSAIAGEDFVAVLPLDLTFAAMVLTNCVGIVTLEDHMTETNETFVIQLSADDHPLQSLITFKDSVTVVIIDNDVTSSVEDLTIAVIAVPSAIVAVLVIIVVLAIFLVYARSRKQGVYDPVSSLKEFRVGLNLDRVDTTKVIVDPNEPLWNGEEVISVHDPLEKRTSEDSASEHKKPETEHSLDAEPVETPAPHPHSDSSDSVLDRSGGPNHYKLSIDSYIYMGMYSPRNGDSGNFSSENSERKLSTPTLDVNSALGEESASQEGGATSTSNPSDGGVSN